MDSPFEKTVNKFKKNLLDFIDNSSQPFTKRQLINTLKIKGKERAAFEYILKHLNNQGYLDKAAVKKAFLQNIEPKEKNQFSQSFKKNKKNEKTEFISPSSSQRNGKLNKDDDNSIRVGLFLERNGRGRLISCHRKDPYPPIEFELEGLPEIPHQYVVTYQIKPHQKIHIEKILGSIDDPKTYSLMATYTHHLPHHFSDKALNLAQRSKIPSLEGRTDFRSFPLVTIDGETAKDFDDAVWATPDDDPRNPEGWRAIVAIADVSYYVRSDDALDLDAYERGNSVYFADHVIPMLPEALSNEMCSLKPDQDRACLAVEIVITADGKVKSHRFKRGLMRSKARLTYNQVQKAIGGDYDEITGPLWKDVLQPLYGTFRSLLKARRKRGTLDLEVPEKKIVFNKSGQIVEIIEQERFESHQLIEELMIAANVCAAKTLLAKKFSTLFRVHDLPEVSRVENLKTVLKSLKIQLPKVKAFNPSHFQMVLNKVHDSPYKQLINDLVLRSQAQANYSPHNVGHFGLSLVHYCHFTSPIRRYADLIVHRGLVATLGLGEGGQDYPLETLEIIGQHISQTERRAAKAEREVNDRLITAFLENHIGEVYHGSIVGVTGAGIFIQLKDTGADGFISKSRLPADFYQYEENSHRYIGQRTKKVYQLGQNVIVRLEAADPVICSTTFSLLEKRPSKDVPLKQIKPLDKKSIKKLKSKK